MRKAVVIFGTGTLAKLAHYYATHEMNQSVCAFVVNREYRSSAEFLGLPVLDWEELVEKHPPVTTKMHVAVGYKSMLQRQEVFAKVINAGYQLINIRSSAAYLAQDICMGTNNFFMPGAVCEPGVKIGSNNVVWSNATVCHDVKIGNHNFIAGNVTIGGETILGDRNFLGFSCVVLQQKRLGDGVLVAASSLVTTDVESHWHYQGIPAQKFKKIDPSLGVHVK